MNNDEKKSSVKNVSPASGEQGSNSSTSNAELDYGIPNFAFPDIVEGGGFIQNNDPRDTLAKVEANLDIPIDSGTGWENGDSINAKPSSNNADPLKDDDINLTQDNGTGWENDDFVNAVQSNDDTPPLEDDGYNLTDDNETGWENDDFVEAEPSSHEAPPPEDNTHNFKNFDNESSEMEATVMPFPGTTIPRSSKMDPSELLSGSEIADNNLFEDSTDDYSEQPSELEQSGSDAIADAVQSALQNVYGTETETPPEPSVPDFGQFSVAESLRQDAAAQAATQGAYWHDDDNNAENAPSDEGENETVLDYLYSNRRAGPERLQEPNSPPSTNDFSGFGATGPDVGGDYYGHQQDARSSHSFDDDPDWAPPSFVTSSSSEPGQYPAPMTTTNPESLAVGSPDSSHLLGAAGLGLIGGIALAGVLAVFVFNSFVEEDDPAVSPGIASSKVIERLDGEANANQTVITPNGTSETTIPGPNAPAIIAETRQAALEPQPVQTEPEVISIPPEPEKPLNALDVAGLAGTEIPLKITMSDELSKEAALMSLKGLTENCKLSTGIDVGAGQWLLPTARLNTLTVATPKTLNGTLNIEIQLLKDDAQTPISEPVSFNLVVNAPQLAESVDSEPASVLTGTNEQATQLVEATEATPEIDTDPLTQLLIRDGNKLMRDGDILGARRLYEQAAANGNPEAALAMGRSYDPSYFEKLPVRTGKPDPATAFQWYKQALDGGLVTARVKIDGLKQWLQQ